MKAVFLDRGSFPSHIEVSLPDGVELTNFHNSTPDEVANRIADADIVLTNKAKVFEDSIRNAKNLKLIQVMATGMNNVDLNYCAKAGIQVMNVEGYSTLSVPEHTFSMMLALRRNLIQYVSDVKSGKWASSEFFCFTDYPITDLANTTLAIYGSGALGSKVASIATAFGMKPIFVERKNAANVREGYVPFEEAISKADIHTFHCPLTEETEGLISDKELNKMKPSALIINAGRGGLVDETALVRALSEKKIAGAAFDVATVEPMPEDHPFTQLQSYPNFLLTPHVAWASDEAMKKLVDIAMTQIRGFISDRC